MPQTLLVPDPVRLARKLDAPSPNLARLYSRFRDQLDTDPDFRSYNIFLPALLGEGSAIDEARGIVAGLADDPVALAFTQDNLDHHIWCIAPRALRLAAFFTWLDLHSAWSVGERDRVAGRIVDFFYDFVIPVLRARTPGGHNQQLSMTFCSVAAGHALASVPGCADRAAALEAYAMPKFRQSLGLMNPSGYSGEGTTYQSSVVTPLVMWSGIFLGQLGEADAWTRRYEPNGASLLDTLRTDAEMAGPGGLLPPWDHYGWQRICHFSGRVLWAGISGRHGLLEIAESGWDNWNKSQYLAWRPDDRLWTLLYWPEDHAHDEASSSPGLASSLSGWSNSTVAAATDYAPAQLRVMLAWDGCSSGVQGIGRAQVNPNHLMISMGTEPVTGDGWEPGKEYFFSDASVQRMLARLTDSEKAMIARQYGTVDKWAKGAQQGLLGASCSVIMGDDECYFPRESRAGQLVFESRTAQRHTFAADCAAYFRPTYDIQRMRRTVSVGCEGDIWIVDDLDAGAPCPFVWRIWLRRAARLAGPRRVTLDLSEQARMTMAWDGMCDGKNQIGEAVLTPVDVFPSDRGGALNWPDKGSLCCDLAGPGTHVRFVTCMLPGLVPELIISQVDPNAWEARDGDRVLARFAMPQALLSGQAGTPLSAPAAERLDTDALCDLDETPFALLDSVADDALLAALDAPPPADWRHTIAAMQTLVARGVPEALPRIVALMEDGAQDYAVHSVAAWCLGHARYAPARAALERMADIPEDNTAQRARWALARLPA